ncbi:MAG: inorganic diphosphatase, partial [Paraclostridium sp.]
MEKYLGEMVNVIMDRQLGSSHPTHNFIYTLNYGYIPNTISGDDEEIDVYIIG